MPGLLLDPESMEKFKSGARRPTHVINELEEETKQILTSDGSQVQLDKTPPMETKLIGNLLMLPEGQASPTPRRATEILKQIEEEEKEAADEEEAR